MIEYDAHKNSTLCISTIHTYFPCVVKFEQNPLDSDGMQGHMTARNGSEWAMYAVCCARVLDTNRHDNNERNNIVQESCSTILRELLLEGVVWLFG